MKVSFENDLSMVISFQNYFENDLSMGVSFDSDGLGSRLAPRATLPWSGLVPNYLSQVSFCQSYSFPGVFGCFEKYFPCWTFLSRIEKCFLLSADQPPPLPLVALSLKASVAVPQWPIGPPATFSHPQNTRLKYPPSNTSQIPPSTLPSKTTFFPRVSQVKVGSFLFCSKMTFRKNIAKVTTDPSYWVFSSGNPLHWNLQIGPLALVAHTICTYLLQIQPTPALIANLITRWCHLALDDSNLWWFLKFE